MKPGSGSSRKKCAGPLLSVVRTRLTLCQTGGWGQPPLGVFRRCMTCCCRGGSLDPPANYQWKISAAGRTRCTPVQKRRSMRSIPAAGRTLAWAAADQGWARIDANARTAVSHDSALQGCRLSAGDGGFIPRPRPTGLCLSAPARHPCRGRILIPPAVYPRHHQCPGRHGFCIPQTSPTGEVCGQKRTPALRYRRLGAVRCYRTNGGVARPRPTGLSIIGGGRGIHPTPPPCVFYPSPRVLARERGFCPRGEGNPSGTLTRDDEPAADRGAVVGDPGDVDT
jgi:hypothetical protein